jgi:hypothetical protein
VVFSFGAPYLVLNIKISCRRPQYIGTSLMMVVAPFVFVLFVPSITIMIVAAKRSDKNDDTRKKKIYEKKLREKKREANEHDKRNVRKYKKKKRKKHDREGCRNTCTHTYIFVLLSFFSNTIIAFNYSSFLSSTCN